jgi:2-oxoglutarate ferredoxin oxidoreductase subunit gamma
MYSEIIFAGFGGQGMMLAGQILAYAAMQAGKFVLWMPSYGPEMRGGTANCAVVIGDSPIASPVVPSPDSSVVMNNPSLERFGAVTKAGGLLVINTSLVNLPFERPDLRIVRVAANDLAMECGNGKAANMVALGAYLAASGILELAPVAEALKEKIGHRKDLLEVNLKALEAGYKAVKGA